MLLVFMGVKLGFSH